MPSWQVTYAINAAKAVLPFQRQLHELKRLILPARTTIVQDQARDGALDQIASIRQAGLKVEGETVLEIGSGWYPVAPLVYKAAGAARVILSDAHQLLHPRTLEAAIDYAVGNADRLAEALGVSPETVISRVRPPEGADAMEFLGFEYNAPFDIDRCPMVDIICSHTVLEHIPPEALAGMMTSLKTRLAPGGIMAHGVDHSDHRNHRDPSLSRIDFLKYSDSAWRWLHINPQDYANRLRHPDYLRLFEEAGYSVEVRALWVSETGLRDLASGRIKPWGRFANYTPEEACTVWALYLAKPV